MPSLETQKASSGLRWCVLQFRDVNRCSHYFRKHLYNVLNKRGPFSDEDWVPGPDTIEALETSKILSVRSHCFLTTSC